MSPAPSFCTGCGDEAGGTPALSAASVFIGVHLRMAVPDAAKPALRRASLLAPGNVLLSHRVAPGVPSALEGLASLFGMGRGVSPPPWSPEANS
jgi:hypothetical protein